MDPKIKIITKKLTDERSRKVIFVSHCILNANCRFQGISFRKASINEIVDEMQKKGIGMIQMKCPEQKAWGGVLRKYAWIVLGSKRRLFSKLGSRHTNCSC